MIKGLIFNIQRFSIHDGPGIRTTVFFKGCPLNCRWCANPESRNRSPELLHSNTLCIRCGLCADSCPSQAITLPDGIFKREESACSHCLSCAVSCPVHALTAEGVWYTISEVMQEIKKDDAFYEKSGGGITLSGGEPLLQEAFTMELLMALKASGYHTNIETSGYTSESYLRKILPCLDMVYMDFKHPDPDVHLLKTGVSNDSILNNMQIVLQSGIPLTIRIPVIPRFNHSLETAGEFVRVLKPAGVTDIHLLPFHQMGLGKWRALGLTYDYADDRNMREDEVQGMADVFSSAGFHVQISG